MSNQKKSINLVIVFAVLAVLFMGANAKRDKEVKYNGSPSTELPYASRGSYLVGMRDFAIGSDSSLAITVWYPASNSSVSEKGISYRYEIKMGNPFGTVSLATYGGLSIRDAEYDLSAGSYPLVILSPGFSFGASAYAWLAEHLASYGFVVMAPEHQEHLNPSNELWRSAIERPQDIMHVLAHVDEQVMSGGEFESLIDSELVAVIGHSYGGYTSLAAAGARINTPAFKSHCEEAQASEHPAAWLCDELIPHLDDMADLAGFGSTPDGLWSAWADPRVDAIVSMAGDAFFFGQEGLVEITVPVMAIGGTADNDAPYLWGTYPSYEYSSSPRKVLISLLDAEHMIFTDPCEKIPFYLKPLSGEFCSDPNWDRNYAHEIVSHFATAFLLAELKQDVSASAALAPNDIDLPGMNYEAQGY